MILELELVTDDFARTLVGVNFARVAYVREAGEDKTDIIFRDGVPAITVYATVAQLSNASFAKV